jgi:hypothetical protein
MCNITISNAAQELNISVAGVWYHIKRGRLRLGTLNGYHAVLREDLDKLKEAMVYWGGNKRGPKGPRQQLVA